MREAAALLGVAASTFRAWVTRGRSPVGEVRTVMVAERRVVPLSEVERLRMELRRVGYQPGRRGRPPHRDV